MIIKSIKLTHFKGIESAHIELGRGLNVLYGVNEIGKSSFVAAVRAAFLLPYTSAEAKEYVTWGTDRIPTVILTFETDGTTYRITKAFGSSSTGKATLDRMKGNEAFQEAKGRAVDGKLRKLLAWGIPEPGGKRAPRGLPESYLTNALLGRQDDVTSILSRDIDQDRSETGKTLLTEALGALGQDPMVARLTDALEERTSRVFTPSGQQKRTQDSPLVKKTKEIETHERRVRSFEQECHESKGVETKIEALTEDVAKADEVLANLQAQVNTAREAVAAEQQLATLEQHKANLQANRETFESHKAEAAQAEQQFQDAEKQHDKLEAELQAVRTRLATAKKTQENLQESCERSRRERSDALTAQLHSADQTIAKAQSVLKAGEEVGGRTQELADAQKALCHAECVLKAATRQVTYSQLLAQQQENRLRQQRESEARKKAADGAATVARIEAELDSARVQLQQAERAVAAHKELAGMEEHAKRVESKRAQIASAEEQLRRCEDRLSVTRDKAASLQAQANDARNHHAQLEGERDTLRKSAESFKRSRQEALEAERKALEQEILQAQTVLEAEDDVRSQEQQMCQLKNDLTLTQDRVERARHVLAHARLLDAKTKAQGAVADLTKANEELTASKQQVAEVESAIAEAEIACSRAKVRFQELKTATQESDAAKARRASLQVRHLEAEAAKQKALNDIERLRNISDLAREHNNDQKELKAVDQQQEKVKSRVSKLSAELKRHHATSNRLQISIYGLALVGVVSGLAAVFTQLHIPLGGAAGVCIVTGVYICLQFRGRKQYTQESQRNLTEAEHDSQELTARRLSIQSQIQRAATEYKKAVGSLGADPHAMHDQAKRQQASAMQQLAELQAEEAECVAAITARPEASPEEIAEAERISQNEAEKAISLQGHLARAQQRLDAAAARLSSLDPNAAADLAGLETQLSGAGSGLTAAETALNIDLAAEQLSQRQREAESLEMRVSATKHAHDQATKRLESLSAKLRDPAQDILAEAEETKARIEHDFANVDAAFDEAIQERVAVVETAAQQLTPLCKELEEAETAYRAADEVRDNLQAARDKALGELAQLTHTIPEDAVACARDSFSEALDQLKDCDPESEIDVDALSKLIETHSNRIQELTSQLNSARDERSAADAYFKQLVGETGDRDPDAIERQITELSSSDKELRPLSLEEANIQRQAASDALQEAKTTREVATKSHSEAQSRLASLQASLAEPAAKVLQRALEEKEQHAAQLENLDNLLRQELDQANSAIEKEQALIDPFKQQLEAARGTMEEAAADRDRAQAQVSEARGKLGELERAVDEEAITRTQAALNEALQQLDGTAEPGIPLVKVLQDLEAKLKSATAQAKTKHRELQMATGQLKLIGGAVTRERLANERETLERLQAEAHDFELECRAEKYLLDTLTEESETHAAHLGRVLAEPVWDRFRDLTGERYAGLTIEPGLTLGNIEAAGGNRDHEFLSVGTRHQLAVLIRLALAAHLKSAILLDDQLVHSDPNRLQWFRDHIGASVNKHEHQVIVVTCRPLDYVAENGQDIGDMDNELLKVIDLKRIIVKSAESAIG